MDPFLRGEGGIPFLCTLSSPLRRVSMTLQREATSKCVIFPPFPPASPLSWRCLQWERPNALLEERERFIKDWRDCALSVFYWRLPAFLWACLLQQYGYVRLEAWDPLCCTQLGNNQRAPHIANFAVETCTVFLKLLHIVEFNIFTPSE